MESSDQFNFSLFSPRNLHGRKNRNVILSMLLIWAVAVFGFQFLLRGIQKPTPEKTLSVFENIWPQAVASGLREVDYKSLLSSMVLVKGKNIVKPDDQKILNGAISSITFKILSDSIKTSVINNISEINALKSQLSGAKGQEFLDLKSSILRIEENIVVNTSTFTGFKEGSLEEKIFSASLTENYPGELNEESLKVLPQIMKLYLTHNQSVLTDTVFLGFPFHYFYTAVFLLILFVCMCIVYNLLIEWRLKKEGIVE